MNSLHCVIFLQISPLSTQIIIPFCTNLPLLNLSKDLRKFNQLGQICITGDLNSRTGENLDYVCNINLDMYVDLPEENVQLVNSLPKLRNQDKHLTMFGTKWLTLCKENSLVIVNGRLEPGLCTFYCTRRNGLLACTVD